MIRDLWKQIIQNILGPTKPKNPAISFLYMVCIYFSHLMIQLTLKTLSKIPTPLPPLLDLKPIFPRSQILPRSQEKSWYKVVLIGFEIRELFVAEYHKIAQPFPIRFDHLGYFSNTLYIAFDL